MDDLPRPQRHRRFLRRRAAMVMCSALTAALAGMAMTLAAVARARRLLLPPESGVATLARRDRKSLGGSFRHAHPRTTAPKRTSSYRPRPWVVGRRLASGASRGVSRLLSCCAGLPAGVRLAASGERPRALTAVGRWGCVVLGLSAAAGALGTVRGHEDHPEQRRGGAAPRDAGSRANQPARVPRQRRSATARTSVVPL